MTARLHELAGAIGATRFRLGDEKQLQLALGELFARLRVPFEREVILPEAGRIDFLVEESIGLEVKVGGSRAALVRQLHGYAQHARVGALLVVTTRPTLASLPSELGGKPLLAVALLRSVL